ncbi:MAG: carboxylesterase/lipase family protein, partial [Caulobacteraceae bacterium]
DARDAAPARAGRLTPGERAQAAFVHSCWVGFARTGRPKCAGSPAWPAYNPKTDELLDFDDPTQVRAHFRKAQLDAQEAAAKRLGGR